MLFIPRQVLRTTTMDLDGYETDLADYTLQETPFYETSQTVFDLTMLRSASDKFAQRMAERGGGGILGNTGGKAGNDGAVKKKRKCVSFLPNFVQVSFDPISLLERLTQY